MTGGLWGSGLGAGGATASAHPASALALCCRNSLLEAELAQKGQRLPAARKTGTTIAGVVFKVRGGGGLRVGPGGGRRAGPQRCGPAESRRARARGWGRTPPVRAPRGRGRALGVVLSLLRMAWSSEQTRERRKEWLWLTRTARKYTSFLLTSSKCRIGCCVGFLAVPSANGKY